MTLSISWKWFITQLFKNNKHTDGRLVFTIQTKAQDIRAYFKYCMCFFAWLKTWQHLKGVTITYVYIWLKCSYQKRKQNLNRKLKKTVQQTSSFTFLEILQKMNTKNRMCMQPVSPRFHSAVRPLVNGGFVASNTHLTLYFNMLLDLLWQWC